VGQALARLLEDKMQRRTPFIGREKVRAHFLAEVPQYEDELRKACLNQVVYDVAEEGFACYGNKRLRVGIGVRA